MRETERASKIIHELRYKHKLFVINLAGSQCQMSGLPDCMILKDGVHYWIEFKQEDKNLQGVQVSVHKQMAAHGVHVYVVRFINDKFWLVDEFYNIKFKLFRDGVAELMHVLQEDMTKNLEKKGEFIAKMVT